MQYREPDWTVTPNRRHPPTPPNSLICQFAFWPFPPSPPPKSRKFTPRVPAAESRLTPAHAAPSRTEFSRTISSQPEQRNRLGCSPYITAEPHRPLTHSSDWFGDTPSSQRNAYIDHRTVSWRVGTHDAHRVAPRTTSRCPAHFGRNRRSPRTCTHFISVPRHRLGPSRLPFHPGDRQAADPASCNGVADRSRPVGSRVT